MMTRRDAMLAMGMTIAATAAPAFADVFSSGVEAGQASNGEDAGLANRLRIEMARQGARPSSEEGVAVLIACVNLVPDKAGKLPIPRTTPFNAAVAKEFRRVTAAWQQVQPNAPETDVAKLIQAMADRDAANGGNGVFAL